MNERLKLARPLPSGLRTMGLSGISRRLAAVVTRASSGATARQPSQNVIRSCPLTFPASDPGAQRWYAAGVDIKDSLAATIPGQQERLKKIKAAHGDKSLGEVTVNMAMGGMRGITGMLWETSLLDAEEGIRFRGFTIPELQKKLPAAISGGQPLPEGLLWLLLTGNLPTKAQVDGLSKELRSRAHLPAHVIDVLKLSQQRHTP